MKGVKVQNAFLRNHNVCRKGRGRVVFAVTRHGSLPHLGSRIGRVSPGTFVSAVRTDGSSPHPKVWEIRD